MHTNIFYNCEENFVESIFVFLLLNVVTATMSNNKLTKQVMCSASDKNLFTTKKL